MAYHYNTRARARSDVEPDDISQGDLDVEMTAAIVSESTNVGYRVESAEGLESQPTEVAGSVTTHPQLPPEGGHSSVGGCKYKSPSVLLPHFWLSKCKLDILLGPILQYCPLLLRHQM